MLFYLHEGSYLSAGCRDDENGHHVVDNQDKLDTKEHSMTNQPWKQLHWLLPGCSNEEKKVTDEEKEKEHNL